MITSSAGRSVSRRSWTGAVLFAIFAASGIDEIEITVAAPHQHGHPAGLRVAIDQVIGALLHLEQSLLQGHGLATFVMIDSVNVALAGLLVLLGGRLGRAGGLL